MVESVASAVVCEVIVSMCCHILVLHFCYLVHRGWCLYHNGEVHLINVPIVVSRIAEDLNEVAWLEADFFGATTMEDIPASPVVIFFGN